MCNFENKWLKDCPHSLKPVFYKRYVLFSSLDQAGKFKKYLSSKHPNINLSLEKENEGCLSFLDGNIFREKGKFVTNVYRKKTLSGVYTNFDSFTPETYKTYIPVFLRSGIVYKFKCGGSNATYYGKTKRQCVNTLEFLLLLERE